VRQTSKWTEAASAVTLSCLAAAQVAESPAPQLYDANSAAPQPGDANSAPLQDDSDAAAPQLDNADLAAPLLGAVAASVSSQPGSCDTTTRGHLHPTKRKDSKPFSSDFRM
jgi:hypothetical protein